MSSLIESSEARNVVLWNMDKLRNEWATLSPEQRADRIKYNIQMIASLEEPADQRECLIQLKAVTGYPIQTLEKQLEQERKFLSTPASPSEETEEKRLSLASQLIKLVEGSGLTLFHDQFDDPHAALLERGTHVFKLNSKAFRRWLARLAWARLKKAVSSEAIRSAIETLCGKAQYDGKQIELHVRAAWHEGALFYDLGNGQAVRITAEGWEAIENPPILFRKFPHQKPQVAPARGGNVWDLLKFVNIPKRDAGHRLLFLVWVVMGFIPGFPHPFPAIHGAHGAAKSTLFKLIKELLDPSSVKTLAPGENIREFVLQASSHWFLPLDNLSYIPPWLSDALCRACTGEGYSKRELFTDTDEVVVAFMRIVGLNGISLVVDRPDLLDRCILLELERIPEKKCLPEGLFWARFEEVKPALLGAFFDAVAGAIREFPTVKLARLPRMADFTQWGVAVTLALGERPEAFLEAYRQAIAQQHEEAISASPVALAVLALMKERPGWTGTPSDLLGELNDLAEELHIDTRSKTWPKDPRWVWRRLTESKTNLQAVGLKVDRGEQAERIISIQRMGENDVDDEDDGVKPEVPASSPPFSSSTPSTSASKSPSPKGTSDGDGSERASPARQLTGRCSTCGHDQFWVTKEGGVIKCAHCQPPSSPQEVA